MSKAQELKPDLLPCPMCGGTEILVKKRKTTMVECNACGLVVFNYQDGIERDAIAHWNRRAASSEQQAAQQDAERYKWLLEQAWFQAAFDRFDPEDGGMQNKFVTECARIIDAARASNGGKA